MPSPIVFNRLLALDGAHDCVRVHWPIGHIALREKVHKVKGTAKVVLIGKNDRTFGSPSNPQYNSKNQQPPLYTEDSKYQC